MLKNCVLFLAAALVGLAHAQSGPPGAASAASAATAAAAASAASAPGEVLTEADITRASECGAPGVGRKWAGPNAEQIERHPARPGYRVNEEGYWSVGCKSAEPPPPPAACAGNGKPVEWVVGEHTCTTARPRVTLPPSALQQSIQSGRLQVLQQWIGPMRGTLIERCTDGVRSTVSATCAPVTHCDTRWSQRTGSPEVTFSYDARPQANRIPVGGIAVATGSDGSTLRVQCVAGEIKAAPQCVAGQTVTQVYSGGPIDPKTGNHLGDIRVYRYDGEPIDPGKRVSLTQIEGRRKPDGSARMLIARCGADGKLH